jgi:hypothetical protein
VDITKEYLELLKEQHQVMSKMFKEKENERLKAMEDYSKELKELREIEIKIKYLEDPCRGRVIVNPYTCA